MLEEEADNNEVEEEEEGEEEEEEEQEEEEQEEDMGSETDTESRGKNSKPSFNLSAIFHMDWFVTKAFVTQPNTTDFYPIFMTTSFGVGCAFICITVTHQYKQKERAVYPVAPYNV